MSAAQNAQSCTLGKRRRSDVQVIIPEQPSAKRHHQRHLTSPPPKRKCCYSTKPVINNLRRYSLRPTEDRIRRNIVANTAHIPAMLPPIPVQIPTLAPIHFTTPILAKRPHNAMDDEVSEDPHPKRHHQRHLTRQPPKSRSHSSSKAAIDPQRRYSLRLTRDRIRRNATVAAIPALIAPIPVPNLAPTPIPSTTRILTKRPRNTVDGGICEKPQTKRPRISSQPKRMSCFLTTPAIASQSRYSLRVTADRIRRQLVVAPHIPSAPDGRVPIPALPSVRISAAVPLPIFESTPTHFPTPLEAPARNSVPYRTPSHIQARSIPIRVVNTAPTPLSVHPSDDIVTRSPVDVSVTSTVSKRTHVSSDQLPERERTRLFAMWDALIIRVWGSYLRFRWLDFVTYARGLGLSPCDKPDDLITLAVIKKYPGIENFVYDLQDDYTKLYEFCNHPAFRNDLDAPIDAALAEVEHLFTLSKIHHCLPFVRPRNPLAAEKLLHPSFNMWDRLRWSFDFREPYQTVKPEPQTWVLTYGTARFWGFHFTYSPNKTVEEARKSNMSQDLILAAQQLDAAIDTATLNPEAIPHRNATAERCFYTLYLTRVIVLSKFAECFPRRLCPDYAIAAWTIFQREAPRTSEGDDVFSIVYRHIARARQPITELKRTAETRLDTLVYNHPLFFRQRKQAPKPPFYLVVDEVEAPVFQNPASGRRPACSRLGVNALFYGLDAH